MRVLHRFPVAVLAGFVSAGGWAQNSGTTPLAEQIRAQEMALERAPAKGEGEAWLKLAVLRQDAAQYRDSERAYRKAIALLKSGDRYLLADALDHMGTMYVERGDFSKAEPLERKALAFREDKNDLLGIGISHMHLAVLSLGKRELASAEADAEMAVSLLVPQRTHPAVETGATPEEKMTALIDLSLVRCARGACAGAVPDLKRALDLAHANYANDSVPVGFLDFLLGYALWKSGDDHSAAVLMRNGTHELETQLGWGHPTYVSALRQYKTFLAQAGQTTEATDVEARITKLERSPGYAQAESGHASISLDQLH